ncbi:MAG: hypothetical protein R6U51_09220 [Anaerolineales bacterium]
MSIEIDQRRKFTGGSVVKWVFSLLLVTLLVLMSACDIPVSTPEEVDQGSIVDTKVAQTIAAQSTEKTLPDTDTPIPPPTQTPTKAEETPTIKPTLTLTPTVGKVVVYVGGNTFCREGPGTIYQEVGILNTDQESEILAKDPTGMFWYIVNPDYPDNCWIGGKYATPVGPTSNLPVFTPPPKPSYSFEFQRSDCGAGHCHLWFKIKNTGSITLESISTTVKTKYRDASDVVRDQEVTESADAFFDSGNPLDPLNPSKAKITGGQTAYWHSGRLRNPLDFNVEVTVTICSQDGMSGMCVERVINFTAE